MADTSWPFEEQNITENQWEAFMAPLMESAVYGSPGYAVAQVYADSSGMQVKRRAGAAFVHGFHWQDGFEALIPVPVNSAGQPRIDRIVLRRDLTANTVTTVLKQGQPAASPTVPGLTKTPGAVWELGLGWVYVDAGAGMAGNPVQSIAPGKVTDEREWHGLRLWRPSSLSLLPISGAPLWQEAVLPDGSKYRWDGLTWAQVSDVRNTWVPQAYSGSAPATYAGGGGPVVWNNGGALTSGDYVRDAHWARVTGCVDPATNGPAFQSTATTYVDLPLSPVNVQGGADLGGWTYLNDQGVPVASGRVLWSGIATKGVMAAAGGGAGYAQLTTSNRWRMTFNLSYPVA